MKVKFIFFDGTEQVFECSKVYTDSYEDYVDVLDKNNTVQHSFEFKTIRSIEITH